MAGEVDPWQQARLAWERLTAWGRHAPGKAGRQDDGDRALAALADLGLVRRQLDAAEFEAVRSARGHGRSWSEIAVRLGVARQSAWERWRDVDESTAPHGAGEPPVERAITGAARQMRQGFMSQAPDTGGRRPLVQVPDVVGRSWEVADKTLRKAGLVAVSPDIDDLPRSSGGWVDGVVTDQSPEAGAQVAEGTPVRLWVARGGGGAGVREPRQPKPDPKTGRKMLDEAADEAVG